jgi:hypothetical protein
LTGQSDDPFPDHAPDDQSPRVFQLTDAAPQ